MYIYNLISVYTRSPEDERPVVQVLGTFSDFDDAQDAAYAETETLKKDGCSIDYLGKTDSRLTDGEGSIHLSIATSRINISIGGK